MAQAEGVTYAGFWVRLLAILVDSVILLIVVAGLALIVGGVLGLSGMYQSVPVSDLANRWGFVVEWLYFTLMTSGPNQATYGKMAVGIKVTDQAGRRIGLGRANVRFWSKILSALLLFLGFLMVAFTARKQGLHDKIAGTLVSYRD